ncbi:RHS repeat-associated core domain-containing protein [Aquipseudomonas alcaligenes]|uniref:RHS repeat-associated core and ParB-like nuclease domain-containing protein n=1 Tax=Aquipseudomonas alcaligenes TaxID=43263 RepID=UPI001F306F45|nr:RHS repeat-associated core domain-containing protein [Pseudomonas alcaligenes]
MRITAWLFAVLLWLLGGAAGAETLSYTTYYHNDHLGSPVAATSEQGTLLWRAHFRPYGERQEDPKDAAYGSVGYTGHVQDADSGMVYAGARYHDPLIGRFMAIDPAPVSVGVPGSFNRYLYANNNPYAYTDPDGKVPFLVIAAVAFGGMMVHSDMANAPALGETPQQLSAMDHIGALPGLNAGKAVTALKAAGEAKDAVKVTKSVDPKFLIGRQGRDEISGSQVKRLAKDMKANGYDANHPIDAANVDGKLVILDGHHRAQAAAKAGIKGVPVNVHNVSREHADQLMREAAESRARY